MKLLSIFLMAAAAVAGAKQLAIKLSMTGALGKISDAEFTQLSPSLEALLPTLMKASLPTGVTDEDVKAYIKGLQLEQTFDAVSSTLNVTIITPNFPEDKATEFLPEINKLGDNAMLTTMTGALLKCSPCQFGSISGEFIESGSVVPGSAPTSGGIVAPTSGGIAPTPDASSGSTITAGLATFAAMAMAFFRT